MQKPMINLGTLFVGLFMLLLLGSCAKVNVTCPPAGGGGGCDGEDCTVGGCNQPFVSYQNGNAAGFKNTVTGQIISTPTSLTCSAVGSNKCQSNAGTCGWNKTCRNWYRPTDAFCYCGCP